MRDFRFNTASDVAGLRASILNHLQFTFARDSHTARRRDWWLSTCMAVRDRILEKFIATQKAHAEGNVRRLYYLSLEYMMGRLLENNLHNCGLFETAGRALADLGQDIDQLVDQEVDMGLGNGGLGRLAACILDSLATLNYPAIGYGIRYQFGLFRQEFVNGRQVEHPDNWLQYGNPWEIVRPQYALEVEIYGRVVDRFNDRGERRPVWVDTRKYVGVPWDVPIVGYHSGTVNFLRLWESKASEEFDFQVFNEGGYVEAVREKAIGETISKVLYPNDKTESGKELRLVQQYFFVSCSLRDILRRFGKRNGDLKQLPQKILLQLNDTHPSIAIVELLRILHDEEEMEWEAAWKICRGVFAYTNHTLMPEALETWTVPLLEKVLPRHLQLIFEINRRFLRSEVAAKWPADAARQAELSIVEEGPPKKIRMANLAVIGSRSVNGVAALHTRLLKEKIFPGFHQLYPGRFNNKTNGITPRRWLKSCNPRLSDLIDQTIGHGWPADLEQLQGLEKYAEDSDFQRRFMEIKLENKRDLAGLIRECCGVTVDPEAIFDVQIKRLHEYKRQHLNLLHILTLYRRLLKDPDLDIWPRVFIFAAKAAPGYEMAKCIIHAINAVGDRINGDARLGGKLKIAYLPNYGVTLAERIIPGADVSEQISTAGREASGTGNMKLALNGALTIGTLDGANVEIKDEVGPDNIFIFGETAEGLEDLRRSGYHPVECYHSCRELRTVVDWIGSGSFTPDQPDALKPIRTNLLEDGDPFFVMADYQAYCRTHERIDRAYRDRVRWARMAILNTARVAKFSSDRTVREYAEEIWKLQALPIEL